VFYENLFSVLLLSVLLLVALAGCKQGTSSNDDDDTFVSGNIHIKITNVPDPREILHVYLGEANALSSADDWQNAVAVIPQYSSPLEEGYNNVYGKNYLEVYMHTVDMSSLYTGMTGNYDIGVYVYQWDTIDQSDTIILKIARNVPLNINTLNEIDFSNILTVEVIE
jgi:hypothetical protein